MNVRRIPSRRGNGSVVASRAPGVRSSRWYRVTHGEGGYLIVLTALALLPIMIFVSFSVDVGAWYARASKLQRAADAAALSAAVWMPDLTTATTVANTTAAKNGFTNGGNITITVSAVTGDSHKVKVTIVDAKAPQFFSKLLMGPVSITRSSVARYEQSIPLGSPNNYFGTGDLMSGSAKENVWAAVNGFCATKENGDPRLSYYDNSFGTSYECDGSDGAFVNPDYDPNGYLFEIKMPATSVPTTVGVEVYDGGYRAGSASNPDSRLQGGNPPVTTTFKLYGTGNNTSPLSNTLLATNTATSQDAAWAGWRNVGTINNPCASCVYYLQVYTAANEASSYGANGFGIRAVQNGTFSACSTISGSTTPAYSAGCVQVYPREEMSVFANLSGTTATFYLASIDAAYAGRKMSITLFDPGEGAAKIEVLDPNGNVANFDWTTPCTLPPAAATGGCSGTNVASLDPSVSGATKAYPRLSSSYVFSDRKLTLTLTLPANYATAYGTNTWWRIRYTIGASATDRTTWGVSVAGAPVRLTDS